MTCCVTVTQRVISMHNSLQGSSALQKRLQRAEDTLIDTKESTCIFLGFPHSSCGMLCCSPLRYIAIINRPNARNTQSSRSDQFTHCLLPSNIKSHVTHHNALHIISLPVLYILQISQKKQENDLDHVTVSILRGVYSYPPPPPPAAPPPPPPPPGLQYLEKGL